MNTATGYKQLGRVVPGVIFLLLLAMMIRLGIEPIIKTYWKWGFDLLHLNAMMLSFLLGIFWINAVGLPAGLQEGTKSAPMILKAGVVIMGSLYSFREIGKIGQVSLLMVLFFVFATFFFVIWLGRLMQVGRPLTGVLACGCGICGVSAEIAAAPIMGATAGQLAYCIGVTLGFGLVEVLIYPYIGGLLGLTPFQFGGWAGTGILNSAQVLAVALAYEPDPTTLQTVKVAEIFNITRVLFLPFLLLILSFYSLSDEAARARGRVAQVVAEKFPVFVLGFVAMTALTSAGAFDKAQSASLRSLMLWCFSIGLIGLGMRTDLMTIRQTGGKPLLIGVLAGTLKTVAALAAVLWVLRETGV